MITSKMISRLNTTCTLWLSCYAAVTNICEFLKLSSIFLPIFSLTYFLLSDLVAFRGNILLSGHTCYSAVSMETEVPNRQGRQSSSFCLLQDLAPSPKSSSALALSCR